MIIAFDVGNTNVTLGAYDNQTKKWTKWRIQTDVNKTYDEIGVLLLSLFRSSNIDINNIDGVIVSSVASDGMFNLEKSIRKYLKLEPIIVSSDLDLGISIRYDNPKQLGTDRICNAVGAYHLYGGPVIVVDMGSATTVCAINEDGEFLGGVILPGLKSMIDALVLKAPKLPRISLEKPSGIIATNTVDGINAGVVYGYAAMIDGIINEIQKEMNVDSVTVVGTGGLIQIIEDEFDSVNEIYEELTLEGLRIIYERNK